MQALDLFLFVQELLLLNFFVTVRFWLNPASCDLHFSTTISELKISVGQRNSKLTSILLTDLINVCFCVDIK